MYILDFDMPAFWKKNIEDLAHSLSLDIALFWTKMEKKISIIFSSSSQLDVSQCGLFLIMYQMLMIYIILGG